MMTDKRAQIPIASTQDLHVLIVDDEPSICEVLEIFFEQRGCRVTISADASHAERMICAHTFNLILTDLRLPKGGGMRVLDIAKDHLPNCPVVMMTAFASTATAIEAMKRGAYDYLIKPFELETLEVISQKAMEHEALVQENVRLREQLDKSHTPFHGIIGQSESMKSLFNLVERISPSKTPILILGESGTGKELIAQAIHKLSLRPQGPFVVINCAAIPEHLFESELFGYVRGAFTGAHQQRQGLFQAADGGTLFLDEVGEMPLAMQAKVLRAIQFMKVKAVGATEEVAVDIRILAATNRSLAEDVQRGLFREDLYYRLNVIPIQIPPLRERPADIPLLIEYFLREVAQEQQREIPRLASGVMAQLLTTPFHGNVRELKNLVERALALSQESQLEMSDFMLHEQLSFHDSINPLKYQDLSEQEHLSLQHPQAYSVDLFDGSSSLNPRNLDPLHPSSNIRTLCERLVSSVAQRLDTSTTTDEQTTWELDRHLELLEEVFLQRALEQCDGNRTEAARLLGISFRSIRYRLKKLNLPSSK